MPSWAEFQPYIVTGLALGGLYALSGVGLVVLYRATGRALPRVRRGRGDGGASSRTHHQQDGWPGWVVWITCILFGGVVTLGYGMVFGPALAGRGPLVRPSPRSASRWCSFGVIDLAWPPTGGRRRRSRFPTDNGGFTGRRAPGQTGRRSSRSAAGVVITVGTGAFLRYSKLGTAMRAMANDREITATLGVPVRRVEAAAWLGCGLLAGIAGIMLADLFGSTTPR